MIQKKINNSPRQKLNFETPPKRILQKNIVILHLLVDSTIDFTLVDSTIDFTLVDSTENISSFYS